LLTLTSFGATATICLLLVAGQSSRGFGGAALRTGAAPWSISSWPLLLSARRTSFGSAAVAKPAASAATGVRLETSDPKSCSAWPAASFATATADGGGGRLGSMPG